MWDVQCVLKSGIFPNSINNIKSLQCVVFYFTKEVNPNLGELTFSFNDGFAKPGWISFVKQAASHQQTINHLTQWGSPYFKINFNNLHLFNTKAWHNMQITNCFSFKQFNIRAPQCKYIIHQAQALNIVASMCYRDVVTIKYVWPTFKTITQLELVFLYTNTNGLYPSQAWGCCSIGKPI